MLFQSLFGVIGVSAVLSNLLLLLVIVKNRSMLRTPYNVLVLSLAVTDLITGIAVLITPIYVIGADSMPVSPGCLGEIYCRVIFSTYLVFTLGIVSVYTVTCMALDRWVAVARPTKYKTTLTRRRVKLVVVFIWLWSVLLNTPHLFEIKSITTNDTTTCVWLVLTTGATRKAVAILEFSGKFFLPVLVTFLTLWSVRTHVMASQALFKSNHGRAGLYLVRTCIFTALALTVCWLPNQVYYLLFKYDVAQLETAVHHTTAVLCMFNSSLNPWVCYASNKVYRRRLARLMRSGFSNASPQQSTAKGSRHVVGRAASSRVKQRSRRRTSRYGQGSGVPVNK